MKKDLVIIMALSAIILAACSKDFPDYYQPRVIDDSLLVSIVSWPPDSLMARSFTGVEAARRKARQLAGINWKPLRSIPSRYGKYMPGATYQGIPYSLAVVSDTHVGTQVSLHTYATAVLNPYSLIYTEDLRSSPYNGFDCAPYYGTTCSNSVMYALGIDEPYYTYMIPSIPGMIKPEAQEPEDIQICDLLLKEGHVVMVYDITRDSAGGISEVSIFETTSYLKRDTWIRSMGMDDFRSYYTEGRYTIYRYMKLEKNNHYYPCMLAPLDDEPDLTDCFRMDLCSTKGDCASYLEGESVIITDLNGNYSLLELFKDSELYDTRVISGPYVEFKSLPFGKYEARMTNNDGANTSTWTKFQVINAEVSGCVDGDIQINYSSANAEPIYVVLCDSRHNPSSYHQVDAQNQSGMIIKKRNDYRNSHYKVYFRGEYGTIATKVVSF